MEIITITKTDYKTGNIYLTLSTVSKVLQILNIAQSNYMLEIFMSIT